MISKTKVINIDLNTKDAAQFRKNAKSAGLTYSELLKRLCNNEAVKAMPDPYFIEFTKIISDILLQIRYFEFRVINSPDTCKENADEIHKDYLFLQKYIGKFICSMYTM